jgi:hypothetical protein
VRLRRQRADRPAAQPTKRNTRLARLVPARDDAASAGEAPLAGPIWRSDHVYAARHIAGPKPAACAAESAPAVDGGETIAATQKETEHLVVLSVTAPDVWSANDSSSKAARTLLDALGDEVRRALRWRV